MGAGGGTSKALVSLCWPRCRARWTWSWPGMSSPRGAARWEAGPCPPVTILSCSRRPSEGTGHSGKGLAFLGCHLSRCGAPELPRDPLVVMDPHPCSEFAGSQAGAAERGSRCRRQELGQERRAPQGGRNAGSASPRPSWACRGRWGEGPEAPTQVRLLRRWAVGCRCPPSTAGVMILGQNPSIFLYVELLGVKNKSAPLEAAYFGWVFFFIILIFNFLHGGEGSGAVG